jgi:hypothetical protein
MCPDRAVFTLEKFVSASGDRLGYHVGVEFHEDGGKG